MPGRRNFSFDAILRSARESKGVSLDQASTATKISRGYLGAIEDGRFGDLPNPAYTKGFLRLYARCLGLSADEIVQGYESTLPPPSERAEVLEPPRIEVVERVKFGGDGRWAVPALLLCLVVLATLFFTEGQERREKPAPPRAAKPAPSELPKAAVLPPRSSVRTAPTPPPPGLAQTPAAPSVAPPPVTATPPATDRKSVV